MSKTARQRDKLRHTLFSESMTPDTTRGLIPAVWADTTKETFNKRPINLSDEAVGVSGYRFGATHPRYPEDWEVPAGQSTLPEVRDTIRRNLQQVASGKSGKLKLMNRQP